MSAIHIPARNRTNKDGSADKRYNLPPSNIKTFAFYGATGLYATVEANIESGAIGRLALRLGQSPSDIRERFEVRQEG